MHFVGIFMRPQYPGLGVYVTKPTHTQLNVHMFIKSRYVTAPQCCAFRFIALSRHYTLGLSVLRIYKLKTLGDTTFYKLYDNYNKPSLYCTCRD